MEWAPRKDAAARLRQNAQVVHREVARLATSLCATCVLSFGGAAVSFGGAAVDRREAHRLRKRKSTMPFVPSPGTTEVELRYVLSGQTAENTLYFNKGTDWTAAEMTALAADLVAWWIAGPATQLSTSVALLSLHCSDLSSALGAVIDFSTGLPSAGVEAAEGMPNNVAPCISFHTGVRGRSARGRNYIAGISITKVTENNILGSWMTNMEGAYLDLLDVATANACLWVVLSRFSGMGGTPRRPIPRAEGVVTPIIGASFTDGIVDSQRKRLPNH